jgi:hypothetical protein
VTIFELVKIVLDELYQESTRYYGAQVDTVILDRMKYLAASYTQLTSATRAPVNYADPATRFAYVYKYVTAHADYIVQVMSTFKSSINGPVFKNKDLQISCIGGGPGSDLIGILKYLDNQSQSELVSSLTAYMLDKQQAWADTWVAVNQKLGINVNFTSAYQIFDVTDPNSWQFQQRFLGADLFTLSYFVSEIIDLDKNGEANHFWNTLLGGAKSGAYILYSDNGHTDFTNYFDSRWQAAGWQCVLSADNFYITPSASEQANELADYKAKFGQMPKLKSQLTYRIIQKT